MKVLTQLWRDDLGFIISAELVLIATILVIGMIVGLVSLRDQVVQELGDVGAAFSQLVQSYSFSGITGHTSSTAGSAFADFTDFCDDPPDESGFEPLCISVSDEDASTETP
ncbi:MAG: hypothetical protein MUE50_09435 [Pirellulaceae bacterium]|nr:hypothetical protein [Pirellulaceae bacterium]